MNTPVIRHIETVQRFASQRLIRVTLDYPEHTTTSTFVGSDTPGYPGPVFASFGDLSVYVESPERFGDTFNHDWIRAFYAE